MVIHSTNFGAQADTAPMEIEVEKIVVNTVEKIVEVEKIIEKPVYSEKVEIVEKIIEKPVHVTEEKI